MIIAPNDKHGPGSSKAASNEDESPPDYASHSHVSQPSSSSSLLPRPSNFVSVVKKDGSVRGVWVIDPSLDVPASVLAPLADNEVRHNFSVVAKDGRIDVDITVVQGKNQINHTKIIEDARKRVTMYIKAKDGRVRARLHDPPPSFPLPRPFISLVLHAHDGSVSLSLPRSFNGPLNITTPDGSVHFSPDTAAAITTFMDTAKARKCFLGDYSSWRDGDAWLGDEAGLDVDDGSVRIQFDDEVLESPKGFWAKLFDQY